MMNLTIVKLNFNNPPQETGNKDKESLNKIILKVQFKIKIRRIRKERNQSSRMVTKCRQSQKKDPKPQPRRIRRDGLDAKIRRMIRQQTKKMIKLRQN